jgi:hypothetical protein
MKTQNGIAIVGETIGGLETGLEFNFFVSHTNQVASAPVRYGVGSSFNSTGCFTESCFSR